MIDGSELRRSRREVLGLVSGTAGLTIGGVTGVEGRRTESPAGAPGDSATVLARSGRQPGQPLRAGAWAQQAKLAANDGDSDDNFGISVAVSDDGSIAIVGAVGDDDPNGERAGSAYVFEKSGGEWTQEQKLFADDGDNGDFFGMTAISGDGTTAIIGANQDEDPSGRIAGSAYVFDGSGGEWTQQAKLADEDGNSGDVFASTVAISADGTTAIIGAEEDENQNGYQAGSARLFDGSGGEWTQQAKLVANDGDAEDRFGASVAVSDDGTTAIVGASTDEDPNGREAGSAYLFGQSDGEWTQQAKLAAADGDNGDIFGSSVAVSGDGATAFVGAGGDDDPNGERAGSVYVFERSSGEWTQEAKLAADDGDDGDLFGAKMAVSRDGRTAITGAWLDEDPNGDGAGSAYVFGTGQSGSETTTTGRGDPTTTMGGETTERTTGMESGGETTERSTDSDSGGQPIENTTDAETGGGDGGSTPGFGVGSLLAGLTGTGYLLWRNSEDDTEQ